MLRARAILHRRCPEMLSADISWVSFWQAQPPGGGGLVGSPEGERDRCCSQAGIRCGAYPLLGDAP
jgi:hypothetical protein